MTCFVRGGDSGGGGDEKARDERRDRGMNQDGVSNVKSSRALGYGTEELSGDKLEDFRNSGENDRLRCSAISVHGGVDALWEDVSNGMDSVDCSRLDPATRASGL
jgi:hypothetical protein